MAEKVISYKINIPKEKLEKLYNKDLLSIKECAKSLDCSGPTVQKRLIHYGIKKVKRKKKYGNFLQNIIKEELIDLYTKQKKTTIECGNFFNCSSPTIARRLEEFKIPKRNKQEASFLRRHERIIDRKGYAWLYKPNHPNTTKRGYIFEHRFVMSEHLGRPLTKDETIHHKNGDRLDNRLENLELKIGKHAWGQKVSDKINSSIEILLQYAPILINKKALKQYRFSF